MASRSFSAALVLAALPVSFALNGQQYLHSALQRYVSDFHEVHHRKLQQIDGVSMFSIVEDWAGEVNNVPDGCGDFVKLAGDSEVTPSFEVDTGVDLGVDADDVLGANVDDIASTGGLFGDLLGAVNDVVNDMADDATDGIDQDSLEDSLTKMTEDLDPSSAEDAITDANNAANDAIADGTDAANDAINDPEDLVSDVNTDDVEDGVDADMAGMLGDMAGMLDELLEMQSDAEELISDLVGDNEDLTMEETQKMMEEMGMEFDEDLTSDNMMDNMEDQGSEMYDKLSDEDKDAMDEDMDGIGENVSDMVNDMGVDVDDADESVTDLLDDVLSDPQGEIEDVAGGGMDDLTVANSDICEYLLQDWNEYRKSALDGKTEMSAAFCACGGEHMFDLFTAGIEEQEESMREMFVDVADMMDGASMGDYSTEDMTDTDLAAVAEALMEEDTDIDMADTLEQALDVLALYKSYARLVDTCRGIVGKQVAKDCEKYYGGSPYSEIAETIKDNVPGSDGLVDGINDLLDKAKGDKDSGASQVTALFSFFTGLAVLYAGLA